MTSARTRTNRLGRLLRRRARQIAVALAVAAAVQVAPAAAPPGLTLKTTVELSPGADVYTPFGLALNRTTQRLFVLGAAVKILESASGTVVGGTDLGRYNSDFSNFAFVPRTFAIDDTAAPAGNALYVLGSPGGGISFFLRILDGTTGANLTSQGTDIPLPLDGVSRASMVVNGSNHKIYLVDQYGKVVVVDGPNRKVIATLPTEIGGQALLVGNPAANKVFAFGARGAALIDCNTDTFTPVTMPDLLPTAAAFNPTNGRIYIVGSTSAGEPGLFALDGNSGALVSSRTTGTREVSSGVTVDPAANLVYVATGNFNGASIAAYRAEDLSPAGSFSVSATKVIFDSANGGRLFSIDQTSTHPEVGMLNVGSGVEERITIGYTPVEIAVNSATNRAYVTDRTAPELLVLDATTHAVRQRVRLAASDRPRSLALSEAVNRIYLTRGVRDGMTGEASAFLDVLDGGTHALLQSIKVSATDGNTYVAVDDVRKRVYVTGYQNGDFQQAVVFVLDSETNALLPPLSTPGFFASGLAVNPVTGRVYVPGSEASRPDLVAIVNPETGTVVATLPTGFYPGPTAINPRTNRVYVANTGVASGANSVTVINGATDTAEPILYNTNENNGNSVAAVAVDESANIVYVADATNGFDQFGRVNAFDANRDNQYLGQIELGSYPTRLVFNRANRELLVTNDGSGTVSVLQAAAAPPANLVNISTRTRVGNGDDVIVGGFIITGPAGSGKRVAIRAIAPSLAGRGVAGTLQDPFLAVFDSQGGFPITQNNDWQEDPFTAENLQKIGLAPTDAREAAVIEFLEPGSYTALVAGSGYGTPNGGGTGVALVEIYDLDQFSAQKLVNISTRGQVGAGDNVMIGGIILQGDGPARVVVRAIGPSLTSRGVSGALQDPTLEVYDGNGALVAANDNWRDSNEAEIQATTIAPTDNRESAVLARLSDGAYTAVVRGKGGSTGVALVEAYNLQ